MMHFAGTKDKIIPVSVAENFARKTGDAECITVNPVEGATHTAGWRERWSSLLLIPPSVPKPASKLH
jgi:hypothetical protein